MARRFGYRQVVVGVLGALAVLAVCSVTAGGVFRGRDPALALKLYPIDARAQAAQALAGMNDASVDKAQARAQALSAIRRDPLVNDAYMALASQGMRDRDRLRSLTPLVQFSERLSRRHVPTQLWLIEQAAAAGDLDGALRHYDVAMRTEPRTRTILFPTLGKAAEDPVIGPRLLALLKRDPNWQDDFLEFYLPRGNSGATLALLAQSKAFDPGRPLGRTHVLATLERLVELGDIADARAIFHRWAGKRENAALLADGSFEIGDAGLPPFDWIYSTDFRLDPEVRPRPDGKRGNAVFLPRNPEQSGEVVRKAVLLRPGRYTLRADFGGIEGVEANRPRLFVRCGTHQLTTLMEAPLSATVKAHRIAVPFAVAPGCAPQWVSVYVAGGWYAEGELEPWVSGLAIERSAAP